MMSRLRITVVLLAAAISMSAQAPQQATPPQVVPTQPPQAGAPQTVPQTTPAAPRPAPLAPLSLQNASLTAVIDQLARHLKINYILDPSVGKGGVSINTYGDTTNLDARSLLDLILRINGAGMVKEGEVYRIVQTKQMPRLPIRPETSNGKDIPEDDQPMLNLVFLKYVTVDELSKILTDFIGENATMISYAPANLLFLLDSRRNMKRTMELISLFDSDTFANQRVHLFEVKNAKPSDLVKDLDNIFKSISLDTKNSTVKFLPVDRINTLIAVAPNSGVFVTIEDWLKKLDIPVKITAGTIETYVYKVKYGRADCLAIALNQLYNPQTAGLGGGYPAAGYLNGAAQGGYNNNYGGNTNANNNGFGGNNGNGSSGYGSGNNFNQGFGGGSCGASGAGGGYGGQAYGAGAGAYGYPAYGGYAAQAPAVNATGLPLAAATTAATTAAAAATPATPAVVPPRIVPNPLTNMLLIQADGQQYQNILAMLKELDIMPRQILLEAKIYSVDLSENFSSGVAAMLQPVSGTDHRLTGLLASGISTISAGMLVSKSRELLATLSLNENRSKAHIISEPSLIATDSIPASINVGSQVPVATSSTTIPAGGNVAVSQSVSSQNTGVTFNVNARVTPSGIVTLSIDQEVSSPAPGAAGQGLTPTFNQQVVQTQITMQDGDTIAIGGLISETVTNQVNGIPLLDRIPYIGGLFGSKSYSKDRTELIIFMTPHVIFDETNLIEASDELKGRVKKMTRKLLNREL